MVRESIDDLNKYFLEMERLESFKDWPFKGDKVPCSVRKMAEAGFFWCGTETEIDSAACFICNKVLDGWEATDDPWLEHKKHAPQCPMVKLNKPESEWTLLEFLNLVESVFVIRLERKKLNMTQKIEQNIENARNELIRNFKN